MVDNYKMSGLMNDILQTIDMCMDTPWSKLANYFFQKTNQILIRELDLCLTRDKIDDAASVLDAIESFENYLLENMEEALNGSDIAFDTIQVLFNGYYEDMVAFSSLMKLMDDDSKWQFIEQLNNFLEEDYNNDEQHDIRVG